MTPDLSAVLVHYRQPRMAVRCAETLRDAFRSDGVSGEIVLVDCESGDFDVLLLREAPADVRVDLPHNRGYAGGVNAGLARASGAKILLSNVDVLYRAGSLAPLLAALDDPSAGAVAPVCAWDAEDRVLLPPGFDPGFLEELSLVRGRSSGGRAERRFAAFARDAVRLWTAGGSTRHLSGAVLAARREVFDRVGRFDERFPFEYEETEWERRVRAAGLDLRVVRGSRVRHLWGASAAPNPETERRRALSRRRYRETRFGRTGRALLERAEHLPRPQTGAEIPSSPFSRSSMPASRAEVPARPGAWLALSPHVSGIPFAGVDLSKSFRMPPELESTAASPGWSATIFSAASGLPIPAVGAAAAEAAEASGARRA